MSKLDAKSLFAKYQSGQCTPEEKAVVENWLTFGEATSLNLSDAELEEDLNNLRQRLIGKTSRKVKLWPRIAVAAAAVAAITLGIWLYNISNTPRHPEFISGSPNYANDIAPGKNTATLTLANGKTILLDTNRTSVVVTDSVKTMTMLTASTPRGGTYQVTLPDGTKVWLNADSKISFPSQFTGKERKILLEGEAYFEVAKVLSSARQSAMPSSPESTMPSSRQSAATRDLTPFIVESAGQQVEVLGTHFNINAYSDEQSIQTTLLEGSVSVRHAETERQDGVLLKPNQQSIITSSSAQIQVKEVDVNDVIDWKNGDFILKGETLEAVMRKISRWYKVDVSYAEDAPRNLKLGGYVSRSRNISAVLDLIERTGEVKFKIQGNIVQVVKQ